MCEEYSQRWLIERTLKWVVSAEQKSMTEEISTLSCTRPTFFKINVFIFSSFIFFIYFFLQCCVGFCNTTILILFISACTGSLLQCMGVFLLRITGSSGQASAVVAHGLSWCTSRPQSRGPIVEVHEISCFTTGRWEFPRPGTEPVSPALAGKLFYHWATREAYIPH